MMVELSDIDPNFRAQQAGLLLASDDVETQEKGLEILQSLTPQYKCKAIWRRDCFLEEKERKEKATW
jgi:hypothetical protein